MTTPSTTYTRISTITPAQITARLKVADKRVLIAARDMTDRFHRRSAAPTCPEDLAPPELPAMPPVPESVCLALSGSATGVYNGASRVGYYSAGDWRLDKTLTAIHRDHLSDKCEPLPSAPASLLVEAICDADAYADFYEQSARLYAEKTALWVQAHTSVQEAAVRDLAALVAQAQ